MKIGKRTGAAILVLLMLMSCITSGLSESARTLSLPRALALIEAEAFMGDKSISAVTLSQNTTSIGKKAFANCANLKDVYFPNRKVNIASDAFYGCKGLTFHIYRGSDAADYAQNHGFSIVYIDGGLPAISDLQTGLNSILIDNPLTVSALAGDEDINRLILITDGSELPEELDQYDIRQIAGNDSNLYILQFAEGDMTHTRDCHDFLEQWSGTLSVEYDKAMDSSIDEEDISAASWSGWQEDPMRFAEYSNYVAENNNGKRVVVAVVDSGVNSSIGHVLAGKDCVDLVNPNPHEDSREHGTAVAGVIVDCCNDLDVNILPVKVAEKNGKILCSKLIMALDYAMQQNVNIINLSFVTDASPAAQYCLEQAIARGITVVAAAGNDSESIDKHFPANVDKVISVSGIGSKKTGGVYSLLGNLTSGGTYAAPASDISVYRPGGTRRNVTGTSFAAPQISAAIALTMLDTQHDASDIDRYCQTVKGTVKGLPDLGKLAAKLVGAIDVTLPTMLRYRDNQSPYGPFSIGYSPKDATDPRFEVKSLNADVLNAYLEDGYLYLTTLKSGEATVVIRALDEGGFEKRVSVKVYSPVTAVSLSGYTETELHIGDSVQLKANATPSHADNRNVKWSSSKKSIASVDSTGKVTALSEGKVTITASAADGYGAKASVTFDVTPIPEPNEVIILNAPASIAVGNTVVLEASVLPEKAPQEVVWNSSVPTIASIDETTGSLKALSKGNVTIMVRPKTGSGLAYVTIEVIQLPTKVSVDGEDTVRVGDTLQMSAEVEPSNANNKSVTWRSGDTNVATVSASGLVLGVNPGTVTIYATSKADNSVKGSRSITVKPKNFQIMFNANDGVCDTSAITATCGEPVGTLPVPVRDYFHFDGWLLSNGDLLTAESVFETDDEIQVSAKWTAKPWSEWVRESDVPTNSRIVDTKWTYTEKTTNTSASMSGWTQVGSEWRQSGSGSFNWASFQWGYKQDDGYYQAYSRSPYSAYENSTSKRTVSNSVSKYVYWHWMYDVPGANGFTNRAIYYTTGYNNAMTGNNYYYQFFEAVESGENLTYTADMAEGGNGNWGQDDANYSWFYYSVAGKRSGWWYKTPVYLCSYTDYTKYFTHTRTVETASQPTASGTVSNIQKYVKYQEK